MFNPTNPAYTEFLDDAIIVLRHTRGWLDSVQFDAGTFKKKCDLRSEVDMSIANLLLLRRRMTEVAP